MLTNVYLPQLELTMANATVAAVHVKEGDWVRPGQALFEVESEKALSEVPAPAAGCVRKVFVQPGQTLPERALLCILTDTADEPVAAPSTAPSAAAPSPGTPASPPALENVPEPEDAVKAAPAARKLAKELGLDLASIRGTGPGGRITVEDVRNA